MAAVTHQKYEAKQAIYRLLIEFLDSLDHDERKVFALALSENHMAKLSAKELRDWQRQLESHRHKWTVIA